MGIPHRALQYTRILLQRTTPERMSTLTSKVPKLTYEPSIPNGTPLRLTRRVICFVKQNGATGEPDLESSNDIGSDIFYEVTLVINDHGEIQIERRLQQGSAFAVSGI